jgi:hypothetical protein
VLGQLMLRGDGGWYRGTTLLTSAKEDRRMYPDNSTPHVKSMEFIEKYITSSKGIKNIVMMLKTKEPSRTLMVQVHITKEPAKNKIHTRRLEYQSQVQFVTDFRCASVQTAEARSWATNVIVFVC